MLVLGDPVLHVLPANDKRRDLSPKASPAGWELDEDRADEDKRCRVVACACGPGHFDQPLVCTQEAEGKR